MRKHNNMTDKIYIYKFVNIANKNNNKYKLFVLRGAR